MQERLVLFPEVANRKLIWVGARLKEASSTLRHDLSIFEWAQVHEWSEIWCPGKSSSENRKETM